MYAIKLATLAGYRVVTTCSAKNFEVVKALGASAAFDYKDPDAPEKIKTWVKELGIVPLRKGLDCISEKSSLLGATSCFADGTGELATLRTSTILGINAYHLLSHLYSSSDRSRINRQANAGPLIRHMEPR
jgi:NADPH:quinone reductase-like Zn-dependent oxidoreductase